MPNLKTICREMWASYRLSIGVCLCFLAPGIGGLGLMVLAGVSSTASNPDAVLSARLLLLIALLGIGAGLYLLGRTFLFAQADVRFEEASPEEQDEMISRETGIPLDLVRRYRKERGEPMHLSATRRMQRGEVKVSQKDDGKR